MNDTLDYKLTLRDRLYGLQERALSWLAHHMPRSLAYHVGTVIWTDATDSRLWGAEPVMGEMTCADALSRWEHHPRPKGWQDAED